MKISFQTMSFGAALGMIAGCWRAEPNHCGSNLGDASCADGMFCSGCVREENNKGCVAELPSPACHIPGDPVGTGTSPESESATMVGPESTTLADTADGTTTGSSSGVDGSSTTGAVPCAGNDDCTDPAAPFCDIASSECVPCDATADPDGACAGLDPSAPLCVNGTCVQCTAESTGVCDEQLLLCDATSNTCVSCTEHGQCSSGACSLGAGICFPPGDVVHVDGDGGQDFPNVAMALASVGPGEHRVIVVHEITGGFSYQGSLVVDQSKHIALLAAPGESPIIQGIGVNPGIRVTGAGTSLYVDGLEVSNAASTGVVIDVASAWFDRSRIVNNDGGGLRAENGAQVTMRNCFVGGGVGDVNALEVDASAATFLYTTAVAGFGDATALSCTGPNDVNARNSLFVAVTDSAEVQCPMAIIEHSATELALGGTNTALGAMNTTWFQSFNAGDFHLANAPFALATAAQWELGDPLTDIDGDDRPTTDGSDDVAGADRP